MFELIGFSLLGLGVFALCKEFLLHVVYLRDQHVIRKLEFKKFKSKVLISKNQEESKSINFPKWQGYRNFYVAKKVIENSNCVSLYLKPEDGRAIDKARGGQYLTLKHLEYDSNLKKKYSISSIENEDTYRITIKKNDGFSQYLFDSISINEKIQSKMPAGDFLLEYNNNASVLVAAGIGITPILAMLEEISQHNPNHKTFLFWGVSSLGDVILSEDFERVSKRLNNLKLNLFISQSNKQTPRQTENEEYPWIELNGQKHYLELTENIIGNTENSNIAIKANKLLQISIFKRKEQWFIKDLGSTSSVSLNNKQIDGIKASWRSFALKNGDKIQIENVEFIFSNSNSATNKREDTAEKRDKLNIKNFTLHKGRMSKARILDFIDIEKFDSYLCVPASMIEEFVDFGDNIKIECFNSASEEAIYNTYKRSGLH